MPTYLAIVTTEPAGFRATFPDFAGLEAQAATLEALRMEAQGVVEEHLATAFEDAARLTPKTLDEVAPSAPGAVILALGVQTPKSKAVRINITIQEDLLQSVDRSAAAHNMSRSRFLAKAVESVVTGRRHGGIQIPLSEEILTAVDRAAKAHHMNRIAFLAKSIESVVTGRRHGGIQIPLSEEVLAAADKAAEAHNMNRVPLLAKLIEVGLGLRKGHGHK
jgi:predicted RNase H-like HicB family nuclease